MSAANPRQASWSGVGQFATFYFYFHFLILLPLIGKIERPRPLPISIGAAVLGVPRGSPAPAAGRRGTEMRRLACRRARGVLALWAGSGSWPAPRTSPTPPHQTWSFDGVFGTYDRAALQRGFQVYKEVCSTCHAVKHLYFRDLVEIGYNEDQVKGDRRAISGHRRAERSGPDVPAAGPAVRPDPGPFPNDQAARAANNGALPPDLSLITKAREGGPDYVDAILTGFKDAPASFKVMAGMYYNEYFPGHQIKMPPPLTDNQVNFADNTPATVPQMAHDVATF